LQGFSAVTQPQEIGKAGAALYSAANLNLRKITMFEQQFVFAQLGGGGGMETILMMAAIMGIFYFLMIRPQQKKMKAHKAMVAAIAKGDKIVTSAGFFGSVSKVDEDSITVELAEGVKVKMLPDAISQVIEKK
jgi:preprotein translocase subunit YajC